MAVARTRLLTAEVERNQGIQSIPYLIETTGFGETEMLERSMYRLECLGGIHQRRSRFVGRQPTNSIPVLQSLSVSSRLLQFGGQENTTVKV